MECGPRVSYCCSRGGRAHCRSIIRSRAVSRSLHSSEQNRLCWGHPATPPSAPRWLPPTPAAESSLKTISSPSPAPQFVGEYPLRSVLKVWRDRSDRISILRVVTLICLFSPLGKAIYDSDTIKLDARPITNLIHRTGDWALIFLLVALAVRPLSRILRFNRLLDVRRMIGVVPLPMPPPISPFILLTCFSTGVKSRAK